MQRFVVLVPLALFFVLVGAHPLAMVSVALLSAQFAFGRAYYRAGGAIVLSGTAAGILMSSFGVALAYATAAAGGILVALLTQRGWSYGRRLALVTGVAFGVTAAGMLANWERLRENMTVFMNARIAEMAANDVSNPQVIEFAKWWDVNYRYLGPGSVFGSVLLLCAFALSVLDRWQRDPEAVAKRRPTGFQRMRVPDWMVWVAIAVALLWFVDYRWPNDVLRVVTWNAALGLTFIYWLNGFSILLYALSVFKATAFAAFLVFAGFLLFSSALPALAVFGFFDTWYDFRTRFRRLAILRRLSYRTGDRDS